MLNAFDPITNRILSALNNHGYNIPFTA